MDLRKFIAALVIAFTFANPFANGQQQFDVEGDYVLEIKTPFTLTASGQWDIVFWTGTPGVVIIPNGSQAIIEAVPGNHVISAQVHRIIWDEQQTENDTFVGKYRVVEGDPGDKPPPIDPPPVDPPPEPGTDPDVENIKNVSRDKAAALRDPPTNNALIAACELTLNTPGELEDIKTLFTQEVQAALLAREGESQNKDWLSWRRAVNEAVSGEVKDLEDYRQCIQAIKEGLEEANTIESFLSSMPSKKVTPKPKPLQAAQSVVLPPVQAATIQSITTTTTTQPVITMYARPNCYMREQWIRDVAPLFLRRGFQVRHVDVTSGDIPRYETVVGPRRFWVRGRYLTPRIANQFLTEQSALITANGGT